MSKNGKKLFGISLSTFFGYLAKASRVQGITLQGGFFQTDIYHTLQKVIYESSEKSDGEEIPEF